MRAAVILPLGCLVLFHAPDGSELWLNAQQIQAVRPAGAVPDGHVAAGTNTIIYLAGKTFGVSETPAQADQRIQQCKEYLTP